MRGCAQVVVGEMGVAEVSSGLKDSRKVEVVREWKREVSVRILTCWTS